MLHAFFNWFNRTCLNCKDAARLVSESCERELSPSEKMKLKMLSLMCPYTARYADQVPLMHRKLSGHREDISEQALADGMPEDCKERLKATLRDSR